MGAARAAATGCSSGTKNTLMTRDVPDNSGSESKQFPSDLS
jgi:hypothetical protein